MLINRKFCNKRTLKSPMMQNNMKKSPKAVQVSGEVQYDRKFSNYSPMKNRLQRRGICCLESYLKWINFGGD